MQKSIFTGCYRMGIAVLAAVFLLSAPVMATAKEKGSTSHSNAAEDTYKPTPEVVTKAPASPEDMAITQKVEAAIKDFKGVSVNTEKGVVTLMGKVPYRRG